ncbi:hypothetical protein PAXINDRAFT_17885 [Paxillus involutus ATCC 200175]|uniref:Uncharacterized protein n=1 Tax=Paxillus involutus ATCC 200175 TaxID=664439 RepID=A0A0C9TPA3_PAXIN|nr:hypothetical protein PAXINDRAFT_17885 [Paxillus involutus ATCC 200175]
MDYGTGVEPDSDAIADASQDLSFGNTAMIDVNMWDRAPSPGSIEKVALKRVDSSINDLEWHDTNDTVSDYHTESTAAHSSTGAQHFEVNMWDGAPTPGSIMKVSLKRLDVSIIDLEHLRRHIEAHSSTGASDPVSLRWLTTVQMSNTMLR